MTRDNHTPTQGSSPQVAKMIEDKQTDKADTIEIEAIEKSSFYFHKSYYEAIRGVEANQQLYLWWAFMNYVLYSIDDTEHLSLETIGIYELLKHSYEVNATLDKIYE